MPITSKKPSILNIVIWTTQVILAMLFMMSGAVKLLLPISELSTQMPYVKDIPVALTRFIGVAEVLGSLGLILPSLFRIKPILTPLAAIGILTIMVLALAFHIVRGEFLAIGFNLLLGAIALFIAWARYKKLPIKS